MKNITIMPEALIALKEFNCPEITNFGQVIAPIMIRWQYANGSWQEPKLSPYQKIELDPTCKVLHYGQEIFEGMKGYYVDKKGPYLFRPLENIKRFNQSAERMAMPALPENTFLECVEAIAHYTKELIPSESGSSLYIRPFMFASDNSLGIKPSETFEFLIIASPSAAYFKTGSLKVLIEREYIRACPGGVGAAKTGGNYAASLYSMVEAKKLGFDQVLWLDAYNKEKIEEMSGMNFFAVINEKLVTPSLTDTILDGITRRSVIDLAKEIGLPVEERDFTIDELLDSIKNGTCSECFSCGTAVIITPIESFGEKDGSIYKLPTSFGPMAKKVRNALLDLQEGRSDNLFNWRHEI